MTDLLPTADDPVVLEVELTEPPLFLGYEPAAADRFVHAIVEGAVGETADEHVRRRS